MALPLLYTTDIRTYFPTVDDASEPFRGGQKLVFPCRIGPTQLVLKILSSALDGDFAEDTTDPSQIDEVFERAKREVTILEKCDCDNLPKIGPIPLTRFEHDGQPLVAFSEEYIPGSKLTQLLADQGRFADDLTLDLATDLTNAVNALWTHRKIHRDIKPDNIIRRSDNGRFVLLDPGIAFDLDDISLSAPGAIWHTPGYLAPELSNPARKREADCRSDFFLIGTVLYYVSTGRHPFITDQSHSPHAVISNIINLDPAPPHALHPGISRRLSNVIMRLLFKRSHGRFRNCEKLLAALESCKEKEE